LSSAEALASKLHVSCGQLHVKLATGAWFGGGVVVPTSIVCVWVPVNPSASVTVSVTVRGPGAGYDVDGVIP
jgi:hypothetical protein